MSDVSINGITYPEPQWLELPGKDGKPVRFDIPKPPEKVLNGISTNPPETRAVFEADEEIRQMIASPFNFKGTVATAASLPASGNAINDTYYVEELKYRMSWTGSAWKQSSMDESDYTDELAKVKSDYDVRVFGYDDTIGPQLDGFIKDDGTFAPNANWKSLFIDASLVVQNGMINLVSGNLNYYSDYISSIAYFDKDKVFLKGSKHGQYSPVTFNYNNIPDNTAYIAFNSSSGSFEISFSSLAAEVANQNTTIANITKREFVLSGADNSDPKYQQAFVREGDIITVQAKWTGNRPNLWYSNGRRTGNVQKSEWISTDRYDTTFAAAGTWAGFTASAASGDVADTWEIKITIISRIPLVASKNTIYIAANDSCMDDKKTADFVCEGENDQTVINFAINLAKSAKISYVELCPGTYYVDGFTSANIYGENRRVAIVFHHAIEHNAVTLRGQGIGKPKKTTIQVRAAAFEGLEEGQILNVISGGPVVSDGYEGGGGFNLENLNIRLPDTTHPCVAVNYQWSYWGMIKNCTIRANGYGPGVVPVEGSVGVRGWAGWSDGSDIGIEDSYVFGFYVGLQLSGEHAVLIRVGARYNYYGYTFGEYEPDFTGVSQIHPITLINCCDEHSAALPKFCKSGPSESPTDGRCAVDMISFNVEDHPLEYAQGKSLIRATEETPGGWVGRIDYTIDRNQVRNTVDRPFWANGHGKNFRTTNSAQMEMGSTALRLSYAPNYMQRYFDEDLGKVVFCIDPALKRWVDANGNDVD